jgi:AraC-like DNA-binding protein
MVGSHLYMILYGASAMLSLAACFYLLFRRSNAIDPDVTSPVRLRRWTAAFFASMTLSHLWYMPTLYPTSAEDILLSYIIGGMLDFMTLIPLAISVLLSMLQDRRRPLWPIFAMLAPCVAGLAVCAINRSDAILPMLYAYYLLFDIGLIIYVVRATRQYGRWLRDNYADLEHKEVWQSFVVLAIILLVFGIYVFEAHVPIIKYITQVNGLILVCYLLWRVETLSDLSITVQDTEESVGFKSPSPNLDDYEVSQTIHDKIGPLLQQHCIDTQLYLQHDLTVSQLARAIGTNRFYLSQYFSRQGITYNAYINSLRIDYFMDLYRKAVTARQSVTAQQLATKSGFHSYRTFSNAFKNQIGQTVAAWMKDEGQEKRV